MRRVVIASFMPNHIDGHRVAAEGKWRDIEVGEEIGVMLPSSFDDKEFEDLTVEEIADGRVEYSLWNGRNC